MIVPAGWLSWQDLARPPCRVQRTDPREVSIPNAHPPFMAQRPECREPSVLRGSVPLPPLPGTHPGEAASRHLQLLGEVDHWRRPDQRAEFFSRDRVPFRRRRCSHCDEGSHTSEVIDPVVLVDDEPPRESRLFLEARRCAYPQAAPRQETTLARKVADSKRPDDPAPAAQRAGSPRHVGKAAKKKGPEIIRAQLRWWRRGGSNSRPSHCERDALPAELRPHDSAGLYRNRGCRFKLRSGS